MTALIPAGNTSGSPHLLYVNSAPSTAITNNAAEAVFDQFYTYPSQAQRSTQPTTVIRLRAFGVFSTGLVNLGLTVNARWGGLGGTLICTTGSFLTVASAANAGWAMDLVFLIQGIGASGTMEGQGFGSFNSGVLAISAAQMSNSGSFSINTNNSNDLVLTAQWGTAAVANSIQMRTCIVEIDGP